MAFVAKRGVNLQKRFLGYTRKEIKNLGDFVQTLQVQIVLFITTVLIFHRLVKNRLICLVINKLYLSFTHCTTYISKRKIDIH